MSSSMLQNNKNYPHSLQNRDNQKYKSPPKNHKKTLQVKSITTDNNFINQESFSYQKHTSDKKFMLISKEIGYFNKITKFVCSDDKSLLFFDSFGQQLHLSISEAKQRDDLFLLYPNAFPTNNQSIMLSKNGTYFGKEINSKEEIKLDFEFGFNIGKQILNIKSYNSYSKTPLIDIINGAEIENHFWPDKKLVTNSNPDFCLGILLGYFDGIFKKFKTHNQKSPSKYQNNKLNLYLHQKDNIYTITTILNMFSAKYQIINLKNPLIFEEMHKDAILDKYIDIKLPNHWKYLIINIIKNHNDIFSSLSFDITKLFKNYEILMVKDKFKKLGSKEFGEKIKNDPKSFDSVFTKDILAGKYFMLSINDISFIETEEYPHIWDLVMPREDATNYSLAFTPLLKNSDGDILSGSAIFGVEALKDLESFSPVSIDWYRNLNDGNVLNYIKDDALLGLYTATKYLD